MSLEDTFSGAETAYVTCLSYINQLAAEHGIDQALEIIATSDTARGTRVGKDINSEGKVYDVNETMQTIVEMAKGIGGIDTIKENTPERAITVTGLGKCPIYEAAKSLNMDDQTIERICRAGSLNFLNSVVKQLNPKLGYFVREFRSQEHGGCVEVITFDPQEASASN